MNVSNVSRVTETTKMSTIANSGNLLGRQVKDITLSLGSVCARVGDGIEHAFVTVKNSVVTVAKHVAASLYAMAHSVRVAYDRNPKQFFVVGAAFTLGAALTALANVCCRPAQAKVAVNIATAPAVSAPTVPNSESSPVQTTATVTTQTVLPEVTV